MQTTESGGRFIHALPSQAEAHAYVYAHITAWGNAHGLPSDAEYRARLDATPRECRRGRPSGMSVERLRLAETARRWRELGETEASIAAALVWEGADPPHGVILERLEKRLDRLEDDLSKLEAREEAATSPRPARDTVARAAATYAGRRSYEAGCAHRDLRKKVVIQPARWPECLRAEAKDLSRKDYVELS